MKIYLANFKIHDFYFKGLEQTSDDYNINNLIKMCKIYSEIYSDDGIFRISKGNINRLHIEDKPIREFGHIEFKKTNYRLIIDESVLTWDYENYCVPSNHFIADYMLRQYKVSPKSKFTFCLLYKNSEERLLCDFYIDFNKANIDKFQDELKDELKYFLSLVSL